MNDQSAFEFPPFQKHSATSLQAADLAQPSMNALQAKVLAEIRRSGPAGATDEQLQSDLKMNPSTQRPRRIELVAKGLVADGGARRRTRANRWAVAWVAVKVQTARAILPLEPPQ
jgi:hypothetical protein